MYPITPATADDIPELCGLLAILFQQEQDFQPDYERQRCGLQALIDQPQFGNIWVARQNQQITGMVSLLYSISTALGGKVAVLEDMVIAPQFRGQGIGNALLQQAITSAREQGCLRISLLTDTDNHRAQNFYQQQGFVYSEMQLMRLLLESTAVVDDQ